MPDLRVSLVQTELVWHDAVANRAALDRLLAPLEGRTDVVVLPEMFTSGFTMDPAAIAELPNGDTPTWLADQAARLGAAVTGSIVASEHGRYVNRLLWMTPDGGAAHYDKRHLFRMAREDEHYAAGSRRLVVEWRGWKVCPLVCYDLRFPVWSRNLAHDLYDLLLYVANWPAARRSAWRALLPARAIENLAYCIGVNRVGADAAGIEHSGDSAAYDYLGRSLLDCGGGMHVETVTLGRRSLDAYREKFPAHLDADEFELRS